MLLSYGPMGLSVVSIGMMLYLDDRSNATFSMVIKKIAPSFIWGLGFREGCISYLMFPLVNAKNQSIVSLPMKGAFTTTQLL